MKTLPINTQLTKQYIKLKVLSGIFFFQYLVWSQQLDQQFYYSSNLFLRTSAIILIHKERKEKFWGLCWLVWSHSWQILRPFSVNSEFWTNHSSSSYRTRFVLLTYHILLHMIWTSSYIWKICTINPSNLSFAWLIYICE